MTPAAIARIVRTTTEAQGVPERLEDAATVLRVGRLLARTDRESRGA